MSPQARINSTALTLTITVMLLVLKSSLPLFVQASSGQKVAGVLVTLLGSKGLYELFMASMVWLMMRITKLKRLIFGAYFIEGTWVGFYEQATHYNYLVEIIEQDLEGITIRGFSFTTGLEKRAQWQSTSVTFTPRSGVLQYSYICDVLKNKTPKQGVAHFDVIREHLSKPASHLYGYSTDVTDGDRSPSWERKLYDYGVEPLDAIEAARAYHAKVTSGRSTSPPRGNDTPASAALSQTD